PAFRRVAGYASRRRPAGCAAGGRWRGAPSPKVAVTITKGPDFRPFGFRRLVGVRGCLSVRSRKRGRFAAPHYFPPLAGKAERGKADGTPALLGKRKADRSLLPNMLTYKHKIAPIWLEENFQGAAFCLSSNRLLRNRS